MTVAPFPEYRPDVSDYNGASSLVIQNVLPRADGYGAFPDFAALTSALPATCRGYFEARKSDGSVVIFAGTPTRLFKLNNTDFTWVPVSKVSTLTSISNASPAVFSLNSHGLSVGDAIILSTTGSLPTGLTVGTVYYVISAGFTANAFEVSTTVGGTAVNTSGAGSGTHSFTAQYSALSAGFQWQFAQFNNFVFATQQNAPIQVFDITSSAAFADLGGSPPQASFLTVINRFVVIGGIATYPNRIQWSGLNATTTWDNVTAQSNYQDLADGGIVRGISGTDQYGIVGQDTAFRSMIFNPGSPETFDFFKISDQDGLFASFSMVNAGNQTFACTTQGFKVIAPGGSPTPIGREKIDRTFFADVDQANLQLFLACVDPKATRVYWAYKSISGQTGLFDKILCYDWTLNRWSPVSMTGEYLAPLAKPGLTLENLDSISSSIDALTTSLDNFSNVALVQLSAVSSTHKLGFFTGSNLEATLETAELGSMLRRQRVQGVSPITDASAAMGSILYRETPQASPSTSSETAINALGLCPQNISTRLFRGKLRIPYGSIWSFALGIEPRVRAEGRQ